MLRLAEAKARAVAEVEPDALVIGSDQVATLEGRILGKPLTVPRACEQLRAASGKRVRFLTGLCLYDSARGVGQQLVEPFDVVFRTLSETKSVATWSESSRSTVPGASSRRVGHSAVRALAGG